MVGFIIRRLLWTIPVLLLVILMTFLMQSGKIVETGPAEQVYTQPTHEYTKSLLTSVPIPDPREMEARKVERRRARAALAAG